MPHTLRIVLSVLATASVVATLAPPDARAQTAQGGWSTGTGQQSTGPGQPSYFGGYATSRSATDIELGTLYAFSVGYGVGAGVWIDAELGIDDPGVQFLAPAILGVGAPIGVFFLNQPRMPRGMPAAMATGMAIGAGEGAGIASYQFVRAKADDEWGFRGFARSVFFGSTVGTGLGYLTAVTMEPSPRTSILVGSGVAWGTVVGSMFGYGGSAAFSDFGDANDAMSTGGLIGYNLGLAGAAALSTAWIPTYESLGWMWIGFAAGSAAALPVFLFYAGGDHDPRRGLIIMGTTATLGLVAGAVFTSDSKEFGKDDRSSLFASNPTAPIQVTSGGLMPVPGGMGLQVSGILF